MGRWQKIIVNLIIKSGNKHSPIFSTIDTEEEWTNRLTDFYVYISNTSNMWHTSQTMIRSKFMTLNAYIRKRRLKIN